MAVSFFNYLDQKKVNRRIDTAADLILKTGFPIEQFYEWYCEVGVHLRPEEIVLEDIWGDTAKGALSGAGIGAAAGGGPGALIGGALGGFMGGAKHVGRGLHRWLNPNGYRISAFVRNKEEAVGLLHQMKLLADEMKNDTNYAKGGSGKNIHNPNFSKLLDAVISYLSVMENPKLVGASAKPTTPAPAPSPTPTPASGGGGGGSTAPADEAALIAAPEFKTVVSEIIKFAAGMGWKLDPATFEAQTAKEIFAVISKGSYPWPDIMEAFKKAVIFDDTDVGYQELANKLKTDAKYNTIFPDPEDTARRFYLKARFENFGKGMDPKALAAAALAIIDKKLTP